MYPVGIDGASRAVFTTQFRSGSNLLSYERIHKVVGTWPRIVWSVYEEVKYYGTWRQYPLVYVPN